MWARKRKHTELTEALDGHLPEHHAFLVYLHLDRVEGLEASLAQIEARVGDLLTPLAEQVRLLCTIPGIGTTSARVIRAEIDPDMSRIHTVGHLVAWAGLCPGMPQSAGKRRSTRVCNGDHWLKATLVQYAWPAISLKDSSLRARFLRLKARRGVKKAIVADLLHAV